MLGQSSEFEKCGTLRPFGQTVLKQTRTGWLLIAAPTLVPKPSSVWS